MTTGFSFNPFTGNLDLITLTLTPSEITGGTPNTVAGFDSTGALETIPNWNIDTNYGGPSINLVANPAADLNVTNSIFDYGVVITPAVDLTQTIFNGIRLGMQLAGPNDFKIVEGQLINITKYDSGSVDYIMGSDIQIGFGDGTNATDIQNIYGFNSNINIAANATVASQVAPLSMSSNINTGAVVQNSQGLAFSTTIDGQVLNNIGLLSLFANINSSQVGVNTNWINVSANVYDDINSINGINHNTTLQTGANVANNVTGYQESIAALTGATVTGGITSMNIGANINAGSTVAGYTGMNMGPTVDSAMLANGVNLINAHGNYTAGLQYLNGVSISPNYQSGTAITNGSTHFQSACTLQSGASAQYMTEYAAFSNINTGSTLDQYQGLNISPNINIAITNNVTLANLNVGGAGSASSVTGLNINLNNISSPQRKTAINSNDGSLNINGQFTTVSSLGVDIINTISPNINIVSGTPITGTTIFGNALTNILIADDDFGAGPLGISLAAVAYVNVIQVASGKTVDAVSMSFAGGQFNGNGTTTDVNLYDAIGAVVGGGSPVITNLYAFRGHFALSGLATNVWGISIEDATAENFLQKSLAINTATKKVTAAGTGLELLNKDIVLDGTSRIIKNSWTVDGFVTNNTSGLFQTNTYTAATSFLDNFVGDSGAGGVKGLVPAPAAGDAAANKFLNADGTWQVASAGVFTGARANETTGQSIPSGTTTTIVWDTVDYDPGTIYNNTTGQATIVDTGYYQINTGTRTNSFLQTLLAPNTILSILINGTTTITNSVFSAVVASSQTVGNQVSDIIFLNSGDTVEIQMRQDSGAGASLNGVAASNYFSIARIK